MLRAAECVWWPCLSADVQRRRDECHRCSTHAPSQPRDPPHRYPDPNYPFEQLVADFFEIRGRHYIVIVDRYSNWPIVVKMGQTNSSETVKIFRKVFETYGVCSHLTTDGGTQFTGGEFETFMKKWGVIHSQTSSHTPHSNLRAETGVKSVKKIVEENCSNLGDLNTDSFSLALLNYRNTPCRYLCQSPAQILFARRLKDGLPQSVSSGKHRSLVKRGEDKINFVCWSVGCRPEFGWEVKKYLVFVRNDS